MGKGTPKRRKTTKRSVLDSLPKAEQDRIILERLLAENKMPGGMTFDALGHRYGVVLRTVRMWYLKQDEARKQAVFGKYLHDKKLADAERANSMAIVLGEDIEADFRFILRELKRILEESKSDDDRILQLTSLREMTKVLDKLANLLGLMTKKVDITVDLNTSPQWLEMRDVLMRVLRHHPAALLDFQKEVQALKSGPVLEGKALEHQT